MARIRRQLVPTTRTVCTTVISQLARYAVQYFGFCCYSELHNKLSAFLIPWSQGRPGNKATFYHQYDKVGQGLVSYFYMSDIRDKRTESWAGPRN